MGEKKFKRTTVTSALPYANGGVHIGHLAGVYVPADIYVRYLRLKKEEVLFIGGSDEHGVPITVRARKEGVTPQDVVDRYHEMIKKSFEEFGISFDIYSRTTSETHHKFAAEWFRKLYDEIGKSARSVFRPHVEWTVAWQHWELCVFRRVALRLRAFLCLTNGKVKSFSIEQLLPRIHCTLIL